MVVFRFAQIQLETTHAPVTLATIWQMTDMRVMVSYCYCMKLTKIIIRCEYNSLADIDECAEGTDGCAQTCTTVVGNYTCSCDSGYYLANDRRTCDGEFLLLPKRNLSTCSVMQASLLWHCKVQSVYTSPAVSETEGIPFQIKFGLPDDSESECSRFVVSL